MLVQAIALAWAMLLPLVAQAVDPQTAGDGAWDRNDFEEARRCYRLAVDEAERRLPALRHVAYESLGAACWKSAQHMRKEGLTPHLQFDRCAEAFVSLVKAISLSSDSGFRKAAEGHLTDLCHDYGPELYKCAEDAGWKDADDTIRPIIRSGKPLESLAVGNATDKGLSRAELYDEAYNVAKRYSNLKGPVGFLTIERPTPMGAGAVVTVDGVKLPADVTWPFQYARILNSATDVGAVTVKVSATAHGAWQKQFALRAGDSSQKCTVELHLQPATLTITGAPDGAEIRVGPDVVAERPILIQFARNETKTVNVQVAAKGFKTKNLEAVTVHPGDVKSLDGRLEPELEIQPVELATGIKWRTTAVQAPEEGQTAKLEAWDEATKIVVASGEGTRVGDTIRVAGNSTAPVVRAVTIAPPAGPKAEDLILDPVTVPLVRVTDLKDRASKRVGEHWELAEGKWRIKPVDDGVWNVTVENGEKEFDVGADTTEVKLKASRYPDCKLNLATDPVGVLGALALRGQWPEAAERPVQNGEAADLAAGDYALVIGALDAKYEIDRGRIAAGGKLRLDEDRLIVCVRKGDNSVTIPCRVKAPPCALPQGVVTVASYLMVKGQRSDIAVPPAGTAAGEVPLDRRFVAGDDVSLFRTRDDLEYYQGQIEVEGDARKIVPKLGFLTGTVEAKGPLDKLVLLEPAHEPGAVPSNEGQVTLEPDKPTKVPVGDYLLTAKLTLPGLDVITLDQVQLKVRPKTTVTADPEKLLAGIADKLKAAIKTHDLQVAVQHTSVVDGVTGAAKTLREADILPIGLTCTELATEAGVPKLAALGVPPEIIATIETAKYTPPLAKFQNDKFAYLGLREGKYELSVTPKGGKADKQSIEVSGIGGEVPVTLKSCFARLSFTPLESKQWTFGERPLTQEAEGALLPVQENETGNIVVKCGGVEAWTGHVANGKIDKGDFIRGDFTLAGAVHGMKGGLVPVDGAVPYVQTKGNEKYRPDIGECKAEKGDITWNVPVGKYRLKIDGFNDNNDVAVSADTSMPAATLTPAMGTLKVTFAPPVDVKDIDSCKVEPAPENAYYHLNPPPSAEPLKEWDIKVAGRPAPLPYGPYVLTAIWKNGERLLKYEKPVPLTGPAEVALGEADFTTEVKTSVVLTGKRWYQRRSTRPDHPEDDHVSASLDSGSDVVTLIPFAGGDAIKMDSGKKAGVFQVKVRPGRYRIDLRTYALGRDESVQMDNPRECATPADAFLDVPMLTAGSLIVGVSCSVGMDSQDTVLTIEPHKEK